MSARRAGAWVYLTDREAAALHFVAKFALEDEEPSDVRAALMRAIAKLQRTYKVQT